MEGLGENPKEVTVLPYSQTVIGPRWIHMAASFLFDESFPHFLGWGLRRMENGEVVRSPRVRGSEHRNNLLSIPWCVKIELDFNLAWSASSSFSPPLTCCS